MFIFLFYLVAFCLFHFDTGTGHGYGLEGPQTHGNFPATTISSAGVMGVCHHAGNMHAFTSDASTQDRNSPVSSDLHFSRGGIRPLGHDLKGTCRPVQ